jgi:molecular chaperone GrpE
MKQKKKETPEEQKQPKVKKKELDELQNTIENLQKDKDELFAKLQRVSADYDNLQKRTAKQITDTISYEKDRIIKSILPVLDNFEHTLQKANSAENIDVLLKGIQIIYDHMIDVLKSHNVEHIKALGEKFDPSLHEAMMQKTNPDEEEDVVLEEFQKGYILNGRVIRPSKVIVNKLTSEQQIKEESESQEQITETE